MFHDIQLSNEESFVLTQLPLTYSQTIDLTYPEDMLLKEQYQWLTELLIAKEHQDITDNTSWSAYFADRSPMRSCPMPIFPKKASDSVTVPHLIKLSQNGRNTSIVDKFHGPTSLDALQLMEVP